MLALRERAQNFRYFSAVSVALAAAALSACTGQAGSNAGLGPSNGSSGNVSGGASSTGGGSSSGGVGTDPTQCVPGASFASARLTLLSDDQYRNIVQDVFKVTLPVSTTITALPSTTGLYPYNENAQVGTTTVQAYQRAADEVAALLTSIPGCSGAVNAACMEPFLRKSLALAWRRPATDAEITALLAIFDSGAPDGQARQIQLTLEAALLHPAFLYRSELGTNAATATGKVSLTPFELASAVSFALLNSSPDDQLWAKASDGSLTTPAALASEVTRLMATPRVKANLLKKVSYYLDFETLPFISKDPATFPEFSGLQGTLYQSSQLFLNDVVWGGHFSDLFSSHKIYANQAMAKAFGLPEVPGEALAPITVTGEAYSAGLLTQPALLAASNQNATGDDVVHRGLWVHDNLLCAPPLPPPPGNATAVAKTITGSSREQAMTRDTTCGAACHGQFDPFGLVTLSYDSIGRYRTTDPTTTPPGGAIDTTASVQGGILAGHDMPVMLKNASDLAAALASGRQVSDCTAEHLATYTLDHSPTVEGSCELQAIRDRFQQNGSFSELFTSILTSPAFLTRDVGGQ
jgi:Protein of unknown function (DUF1592)/Protein of unknown function (DUF1588)/Protein of unknown function (DUF1595)/Protein of unknown function (DUF1585)/Protein of unknown function (DUF1587)